MDTLFLKQRIWDDTRYEKRIKENKMAENSVLKEIKKARKHNTLEADPMSVLLEVVDELIKTRKDLDDLQDRVKALEPK